MAARAALFPTAPEENFMHRRPFDDDKYRVEDTRKTNGGKQ